MLTYLQLRNALEKKLTTIDKEEYISLHTLYTMITTEELEVSLGPNSPPDPPK